MDADDARNERARLCGEWVAKKAMEIFSRDMVFPKSKY
jgi:hypothetical protein